MFAHSLFYPAVQLSPAAALQHSQQALSILENTKGAASPSIVLQSLLSTPETQELWTVYENLLLSCLRTSDDESAHLCLARLVSRFGDDNERIMALKGLVKEATAADDAALDLVLQEYEHILQENPTNLPIAKRRAALLRSVGRTADAVSVLSSLLDMSPTDAEAWAELADLYLAQGLYSQAIFAQEEVLILQPNAWNIHARLGEMLLMAAKTSDAPKRLTDALKRFSRSVELCDNYLRGLYGLKLTVQQLLSEPLPKVPKQTESEDWPVPERSTLLKLDELATEKLAEIVRRSSAGEKDWQGYDEAELAAARKLLESSSTATVR
ncbi:tetratricopeptide [Xylaria nigripes]|nr:tetratricopeptide [Xylaria nigripes]